MKRKRVFEIVLILSLCIWLPMQYNHCASRHYGGGGSALGLFENAFDSLTTYPNHATLTYVAKDGSTHTTIAFPGQVIILADADTASSAITQIISENGGRVATQIPRIGIYVAIIDPNVLAPFLAAMYSNPLIINAVPNGVIGGKNLANGPVSALKKISIASTAAGSPGSLIQTIDLAAPMCSASTNHEDEVALIAGRHGVSVNVNDVMVDNPTNIESAYGDVCYKLLSLLQTAHNNNVPVIINMSYGALDTIADTAIAKDIDYHFYNQVAALLHVVSLKSPELLDNAVILVAGTDRPINETSSFQNVHNNFPGSSNSLYFVESQEGSGAGGCGIGYASPGTPNVLSAPGCGYQMSNSWCVLNGTSFATPTLANLIGQTYINSNHSLSVQTIAGMIFQYQSDHSGALPTVSQLINLGATCTYAISPESWSFTSNGGSGSITVTAGTGCTWTAISGAGWISMASGSGSATMTVGYSVQPNTSTGQRSGSILIAGKSFTVVQAGSQPVDTTTLPPGFPTNVPTGTYILTGSITTPQGTIQLPATTITNVDINQFAETLTSALTSASQSAFSASCSDASTPACNSSIAATPWNGTSFSISMHITCTCCDTHGCASAQGSITYTVTKQ